MSSASDILVRADADRALPFTIAISAAVHLGALALLAFLPSRFLERPRLESYTVDLVAPSALGGTNLRPGAVGAPKPPPPKAAASTEQIALPAPVAEKIAPPAAPKVSAPVPAPPKVAAEPPPPARPQPKAAEAKPAQPKPDVVVPKPEPKPQPKAEPVVAAKPEPKPAPAVEKVEPKAARAEVPPKPAKPQAEKPAAEANKEPAKAAERPAPDPKRERDRRIAEAIDQRAKQVREPGPSAVDSVDSRIEAAVQRRAAQVGAQEQASSGGGPVSYGPASGAGGIVKGVEYILYRSQMESRIKAAWAWAGANRSLKAVVNFNILPSGEIINIRISEPSGDGAYDASVERALRAVSPLDPPPERYRDEFSTVELEFRPEDLES